MDKQTIDVQFVKYIIESLITQTDETSVEIERTLDEKGVLIHVVLDSQSASRIIGKRGNTAQAIRTLLRVLGARNDARYNLKIDAKGQVKSND